MTDESTRLAKGLKEKVVGNVEKEAGKHLGSEHLKEKGKTQHAHGEKNLEAAREGIEGMHFQEGTHQHHGYHEHQEHGKKHKKHKKHKETHYEGGEERLRKGVTSTTGKVTDVTTTTGESIKGETKVYEHVHPVTVVENTREIRREERPTQTTVHVVKHIEPIQETEVHRHIEPVEIVHRKEVVHPTKEVYVHEHVHPVEVTEIHEHIKPEVHSLERHDVYPDVIVKEKHEQVLGGEVSRATVHREVDVNTRDLDFDIKTGGMREKHRVVEEGVLKPTAIHHEKHHHEGELKPTGTHHEKHHEKHHEGESHGKKKKEKEKDKEKGKVKHHRSDTGKATKTSDTAPKV